MSWRLLDGSKEMIGGSNIQTIYVNEFVDGDMALKFKKAAVELFYEKRDNCSSTNLLKAQDSVLNLLSPARLAVVVPEAGATNIGLWRHLAC